MGATAIIDIQTPSNTLSIDHSVENETLTALFDKLSGELEGKRVGPGWLMYKWGRSVVHLDYDRHYKIFQSRQAENKEELIIYLKDPSEPLPSPPSYRNPEFYHFDHDLAKRRSISPPDYIFSDEKIKEKINKELDSMREMVRAFLENPEPQTWKPPTNLSPMDHEFISKLRIPCYSNGNPSLLFHDLDRHNDIVIKKLFGPGSHKFICNTSGSGKTRRMLEGLTKYWGLYIVAAPDNNGVGIRDFEEVLNELPRYYEWTPDLETVNIEERPHQQAKNSYILSRHLRKLLAARIVVFELFLGLALEVDNTLQEKHKHIWLLFQLSDGAVPHSENWHPFLRIISCLRHTSDEVLDELIRRLGSIRRDYLSDPHFILGLDEAQQASIMYPRAFISSTNPHEFRSIIREITTIITKLPIKFVVSGTGLSLVEVKNAMSSGVSKPLKVHLFHELGMFDTWESMELFLKRYIPATFLESNSGNRLKQRMREYLQGRYRFTVAFLEFLLKDGLRSPHKLFNEYIKKHTTCFPGDTGEFSSGEPELDIELQVANFEWDRLKEDKSTLAEVVQIVHSHLLKKESPTYGNVKLVEYGIARLRVVNEDHKGQIVEPLPFLSVLKWLQRLGPNDPRSMEVNIRSRLAYQPSRGDAFEEVGNLYLLRALRHLPFTSVFTFHPRYTPSWAGETAHIIARLDNVDVDVDILGEAPVNPSLCAVEYASGIDEVINWFEKDTVGAVLIPDNLFGPDVLVRCHSLPPNKPEPVRDVLLMGQYKSCTSGNIESLDADTIAKALTSLNPNHWFEKAPSHQRRKLVDTIEKFHVLRFIGAYPLLPDLNLHAGSVKDAIQALGPNLALATFKPDTFRGMFNSEAEARNVLVPMDAALNRKRKAREISK